MAAPKLLAVKVELPGFPAGDVKGREGDDVDCLWARKTEVRGDFSSINRSTCLVMIPQLIWYGRVSSCAL